MQEKLLVWFDQNRRIMPWRAAKGQRPDPYHVWLSEVMLQQTTVATVGPYFQKFIRLWPRLADLAKASQDEVLTAWAGLGYYARARNLHKCATTVMTEHGGVFPDMHDALLALPGIGPYTAGAISAIAFDRPAIAVDGNVERVISRLYCIKTPMPESKPEIKEKTAALSKDNPRPGDFVQGLMELGSTVCTPTKPRCGVCPWQKECLAFKDGCAEILPKSLKKIKKPTRFGTVFWLEDGKGRLYLRKRPEKGLLGGMTEIPSTLWQEKKPVRASILKQAPVLGIRWQELPELSIRHSFTHFNLVLGVFKGCLKSGIRTKEGFWVQADHIQKQALPSVMQKVVKLVQSGHQM